MDRTVPKGADGSELAVGDVVVEERKRDKDGKVYLTFRGRITQLNGGLAVFKTNSPKGVVRKASVTRLRRYMRLVKESA